MNLSRYWEKEYRGAPFQFMGPAHIGALLAVLALNLSWLWVRATPDESLRVVIRSVMAALIILNELTYHFWNWSTGQWNVKTMLPLHLCSLTVWLTPFMLWTRHQFLYEFCYFMGVGGAVQALLTPDAGRYGFPHIRFLTTYISHGILVSAPIYLSVVEGFRPTPFAIVNVAAVVIVFMLPVAVVNRRLGSNYMYIARRPDTPSLIDKLGPWPWYLPWLFVLGLITSAVLYLPFVFF
jgi:hypothetical integral membrane protein (TIGR02206 family)